MEFFSDILNIIDILAIIPFFTDILLVLLGMVFNVIGLASMTHRLWLVLPVENRKKLIISLQINEFQF